MKIKNWLVRGDTHGQFDWMQIQLQNYSPEETAIIILGDAGLNFYLNKTDDKVKEQVNAMGYTIYCVRGNHEERPQNIPAMLCQYDEEVGNKVYYQAAYPNIKYFLDYGFYKINGYLCLVIGGAYSIDKSFRLARYGLTEETNNPKLSGWFNYEQLSKAEMDDCLDEIKYWSWQNIMVDFVFTHTCPMKFQPTDLFLNFIDQSTVDKSMEEFLDIVSNSIGWKYWLFGHYHADRLERPHVEQYYNDIEDLNTIVDCWRKYDETNELNWWLIKSPNFYEEI